MEFRNALGAAVVALLLVSARVDAFGTHNLYIKLHNEQGAGQFVFGTLGGLQWTCNSENYQYKYVPTNDGTALTISFKGPFSDRPCKDDDYYFTGKLTFEVGVKATGQPGWYDSSTCSVDFGMAWGDGDQACIPVAVGTWVLACIGVGGNSWFKKHYGDSFSASCTNPNFRIVPPGHTSTGYYSWDIYWPVAN